MVCDLHAWFRDDTKVPPLADTVIPSNKIAAYRSTNYRVGAGLVSFVLRIDVKSDVLKRLYQTAGQNCALFITAYNPFGQEQSVADNKAAQSRLGDRLRTLSSYVVDGIGIDPVGLWPGEASFFALGLDEDTARQLSDQFKQDAVVWAGPDAVPRLLLLR